MAKISNRERLLSAGVKVVHERGFVGVIVRDIVQAAGMPQGSFANHFVSKEAFGLEVLDLYFERSLMLFAETLRKAEAVLFLASDRASFITGHIVNVDGMKRAAL